MYLYFDRKGTLLEMVNDEALRRYNKNINYVYVYMENEEDQNEFVAGLKCLAYRFKKPDGRFTIEYLTDQQEYDEALHDVMIPVDVKRDLKHFRYGVKYAMHKIRIPSGDEIVEDKNGNEIIDEEEQGIVFEDNVFELAGPVEMGIQAVFDTSRYTLGKVVFTIENAVIKTTQGITLSQFDYLLKRVNEVEKMEVVGPEGPQGEAAGFGEPTANVTMLEPTEQATVSITTEGPNTQKVFNFDFSIPRGKEGLSVYIYDGILTETTTTITDKTQILLPSNRTLHEGDILLSSLEGYVGAMAKIESVTENEIVVDYIGVLEVQTEGGISDVQVAGTSVVVDGVANIPAASDTQAGVITTEFQAIYGAKRFMGTIGVGSTGVLTASGIYKGAASTGATFEIGQKTTDGERIKFSIGTYDNLGIQLINDYGKPAQTIKYNADMKDKEVTSTLPAYSGTLMSAPQTWSSGTSGTATLPSAGLYEVYFVKDTVTYSTIVRWNSDWVQTICGVKDLMQGTEVYILDIGTTGVIALFEKTMADGGSGGASATTIYFRKIGIA